MVMNISEIKKYISVVLLEECNFSCSHCYREDEDIYPGYKLSLEQIRVVLSDCHNLDNVQNIVFTGGEPTLWHDDKYDLVGLLIEVSRAGFATGFGTNGSYFLDYKKCCSFFDRYIGSANKPLRVVVSLDTFHNNFNTATKRSEALDNLARYKEQIPPQKRALLKLNINTVISTDMTSRLPEDLITHYESKGFRFNFIALFPLGRAKALEHISPKRDRKGKQGLRAFSSAGKRQKPNQRLDGILIYFINNNYYFFSATDRSRVFAEAGHLKKIEMEKWLDKNEDVKKWLVSFVR